MIQAWEAMYWQMFKAFKCAKDIDDGESSISSTISATKASMPECNKSE